MSTGRQRRRADRLHVDVRIARANELDGSGENLWGCAAVGGEGYNVAFT